MSEPTARGLEPVISPRTRRGPIVGLILLALIIFVCGGAAGWGLGMLLHRPPRGPMGMGPQPPVDGMVDQLRDELLLSDDQVKAVRQIYQDRHDALEEIRTKMEPALKAEYDKLDRQMKGVLNAAQYQRWSERFESLRNRMMPPPPQGGDNMGPHGPGGRGPDEFGPDGGGPGGPDHRGPGMGGPEGPGGPPPGHGGPQPPDGMPSP